MSQEDLEIFARATDALNRLDLDAYLGCFTVDYEWFPVLDGTVEGNSSFRGRDGVEAYFPICATRGRSSATS